MDDIIQSPRNKEQEIKDFLTEQRFKKRPVRKSFSRNSFSDNGNKGKKVIWISVCVACLIMLGAGSLFFSRARVSIVPRQEVFVLEASTLTLSRDSDSIDSPYERMSTTDSVSETAVSGIAESSQLSAKGIVRIYNKTTSAERLPAGTLLRSAQGFLYKTERAITVPAQTKPKNGDAIPGSIEVGVIAEKAGRDYNVDLTDFVIDKYKNTSKKETVYARSVTPISGGESGVRYVLDDESRTLIEEKLKVKLTDRLTRQVTMQLPEGYVFYPSLSIITTELKHESLRSETTTLTPVLEGSIEAIIINRDHLTRAIARSALSQYKADDLLRIPEIESLSIHTSPFPQPGALPGTLPLTISGSGTVVWVVPHDDLRQKSVGLSKKQFMSLLRDFPSVHSAEVSFIPFWVNQFPKNISRISIQSEGVSQNQ